MPPSFSTQSTQSTQIKPFGNGLGNGTIINTRITCETSTPHQPSAPLSSSMCATGGFGSGVNIGAAMIRPM